MKAMTIALWRIALVASLGLRVRAARRRDAGAGKAVATFAGGCFWCTEADFDKVEGVISTTSGYIGGKVANPTYQQVSAGGTGHTEAVEIVFDPAKVSYQKLLDVFWRNHDPLAKDRQFCDRGDSTGPAIFFHNEEQRQLAEARRKRAQEQFAPRVVQTEITQGQHVLQGRGLSPGLPREESGPLQALPLQLRPRSAPGGAVGQDDKSS